MDLEKIKVDAPAALIHLLDRLEHSGFSAWAVGGCVRDSLLGLTPEDWDVASDAKPEQVIQLFSDCKVVKTGLKHGTVTVILDHIPFEVTTFRIDGQYADHRRPQFVQFTSSLEQDLSRRDFTVNAMAWHPKRGVADPFGGQKDLNKRCIRCVGQAEQRLEEDALRIMRALRFASVYEFTLEDATARALWNKRALLETVAAERIRVELERLLCGTAAEQILLSYATVLQVPIPQLAPMIGFLQHNPHHCFDVWTHTVRSVAKIEPNPALRMTMLLHDIAKPRCFSMDEKGVGHFYGHPKKGAEMTAEILRRLRYDNATKRQIQELVLYHDLRIGTDLRAVRRLLAIMGEERYRQLLLVKRADILAQSEYRKKEKLEQVCQLERGLEQVLAQKQCFSMNDLAVDGRDLMQAGVPSGKLLGIALKELLEQVIEGDLENTKEALLDQVRKNCF